MSWMDDEPVRGSYPKIGFLRLTGAERMKAREYFPRPPIDHLFGLQRVSSTLASTLFAMPASPWLQSVAGVFTAGTAALVADAPLGSAILATLGPGDIVVTSDLTVNYLRPTSPRSDHLTARARPIEVGHRLGLAEAVIEDGHGEVVAHATTRCFIRHIEVPEDAELEPVEHPHYDTPDPYERELSSTVGVLPPNVWAEKSFLDIFEGIAAGEYPEAPFVELFAMRDAKAREGYFETTVDANAWYTSPAGVLYGGFLAYLADSTLSGAIGTTAPANSVAAPLDLKVNFLRPALPDGRPLVARSNVVHRGKTLALAECEVVNADEKVIVKATSSATIIEGRTWAPKVVDEAAEV